MSSEPTRPSVSLNDQYTGSFLGTVRYNNNLNAQYQQMRTALGYALRNSLDEMGLSLEEVCSLMRLSPRSISRWIHTRDLKLSELYWLCDTCGLNPTLKLTSKRNPLPLIDPNLVSFEFPPSPDAPFNPDQNPSSNLPK